MTPIEQVEQSFLQLCWSIKMDSYLQLHPPAEKVDFDNPIIVTDPTDRLHLPGNQFNTIEDIHIGAENSIRLSLAALFLALDTALEKAGILNNPRAQDSFGQLRTLIYMCRCAYAHNVLAPTWEAHSDYARQLLIKLPGISIELDLKKMNGTAFEIKQIGGYAQLLRIKDHILSVLAPNLALQPPRAKGSL